MEKIDGKTIAEKILSALPKEKPKKFFAAFLVGENEASKKFLEQKKKTAEMLGIDFRLYPFLETISQDELRKKIGLITHANACGGAILQLPLPDGINAQYVINTIPIEKDVDVLSERALGAFYAERSAILPPAVGTFEELFSTFNINLSDSSVGIVGLGKLIGRPIANYCMKKCKNLFLLDKGSDFGILKSADIVVLGAGNPGLVNGEILKETAFVIDFGYGVKNGKIMGDFDPSFSTLNFPLLNYTPTPGGTGPILVAKLFANFFTLTRTQKESKKGTFFPQIR